MNLRPLLLPMLSFAAGAAALVAYWFGGGEDSSLAKPDSDHANLFQRVAAGGPSSGSPAASSPTPGSLSAGTLAFAGLLARPTLDDVFKATGIDRPLRVALFLQTATSDEIAALMERSKKEWVYDTSLTDQVWLRWCEIDREAAFKANAGGNAVWWAWAKLDPQAAVAAAVASGQPNTLQEVIRSIGQGDQDAAIQLLSDHPGADTGLVWEGILNGIGKTDRGAAAALALEKNVKLEEHVSDWVAREPDAAMAWARSVEDPVQRRRVIDIALKELITADPRAALADIDGLPAGRSRTERTAEAIAALSRTDPAAAQVAARALQNPADRQRALSDLADTLAARNPAAALGILKDLSWTSQLEWSYESGNGRSSNGNSSMSEHNSIRQLMQNSPEATIKLLSDLPPDRNAPVSQAVRQWTGHQPEAASRWVQSLPTGENKDRAITGLTEWLVGNGNPEPDYEAALAWGAAASTPGKQMITMQNALSSWRYRDWKSARAAVDRLSVTPEQREQLLRNFGNPPENR